MQLGEEREKAARIALTSATTRRQCPTAENERGSQISIEQRVSQLTPPSPMPSFREPPIPRLFWYVACADAAIAADSDWDARAGRLGLVPPEGTAAP